MKDTFETIPTESQPNQYISPDNATGLKNKSYKSVVFVFLAIFILVTTTSTAYYLGTKSSVKPTYSEPSTNTNVVNENETELTTPSIQETEYTSDWQSYSSSRHGYSFKYLSEPSWFPSLYDEDNAEVAYGAHIITNYDTVSVEEYMDHGIVDWKSFIGNKPAIKLQIAVAPLEISQEEFKKTVIEQENTIIPKNESISQTKIGTLETTVYEYYGSFKSDDMRAFTLLAFPNDEQVITIGLHFNNITQNTEVTKLAEWEDIELLLKSFEFKN